MEIREKEKRNKRRKFLMVLPLLVLPFLSLGFYALGGGVDPSEQAVTKAMLNTRLPEAQNLSASLDKMSLYNEIRKDAGLGDSSASLPVAMNEPVADPNEARLEAKLRELERSLSQPAVPSSNYAGSVSSDEIALRKMEALVRGVEQGSAADSEMKQLDTMLEKLMDLQHPDRAREKLKALSAANRGRVYALSASPGERSAGLLAADGSPETGFYGLKASETPDSLIKPAISAVVHGTQVLTSGATIKLRLTKPVYIDATLIPEGTFLYGTCNLNGERLQIELSGLRKGQSIYPIALMAYDLDAIPGIRVPGAINRDSSKESADQALQAAQLGASGEDLTLEAAGLGLNAVKGLFSKKAKLVRVTIKAGYPVLLVNSKN